MIRRAPSLVLTLVFAFALAACGSMKVDATLPPGLLDAGAQTGAPRGASLGTDEAYGGGPVLPAVSVMSVLWGEGVDPALIANLNPFYSALVNSEYIDWLDEYYSRSPHLGPIGRGTNVGRIVIYPNDARATLADADIAAELASQIQSGGLPAPDPKTLYVVHLPPGIRARDPAGGVTCAEICGYHSATSRVVDDRQLDFSYAVIPDLSQPGCDTGCGAGTPFDRFTTVASRTVAEAILDPKPSTGWHTKRGDPCNHLQATIESKGRKYTVQKLWSEAAQGCIAARSDCQRASDTYGIGGGVTGFAPVDVRDWFDAHACTTRPETSTNLCQKASEVYGIVASIGWGFAPASVRTWWTAHDCNTKPLGTVDDCQRASDTYSMVAHVTSGSAPREVQGFWKARDCATTPSSASSCEKAAALYAVTGSIEATFAPPEVQAWWRESGCTDVSARPCQVLSDTYGIIANRTFGFAPKEVQVWWSATGCGTVPTSDDSCQRASELYGMDPNDPGYAPSDVRVWWAAHPCEADPSVDCHCATKPLFDADTCQRASDTFGIIAHVTFGFAPLDVQRWFDAHGCATHPRARGRHFQAVP